MSVSIIVNSTIDNIGWQLRQLKDMSAMSVYSIIWHMNLTFNECHHEEFGKYSSWIYCD